MQAAPPPGTPLTFDAGTLPNNAVSSIDTTFTSGNQVATQTFDLTQSGLWSFRVPSAGPSISATLTGPLGTVTNWPDLAQFAGQNLVYFLPAGQYTLTLNNQAALSGSATLALTPFASAVSLDNASAPNLSTMTVGQQSWYSLDAHAGDTFSAAISSAGPDSDFDVSVYNVSGQLVVSSLSGGSFTTNYAGPVTVLVQRIASSGGSASLSLTDTAGPPSTPLPVVQPGSQVDWQAPAANFSFTVASDGLVAIEWDGGDYQSYQLTGPSGVVSGGAGGSPGVQWLVAGNYQLKLYNGTGPVQFEVADLTQATSITAGAPVSQTMSAGQQYALFKVTLNGSMNTWFSGLSGASAGETYYLYNPAGTLVATGNAAQTGFNQLYNLALSGQYLLVVSRPASAASGTATINFNLSQTPNQPVPLQFGTPTQGTVFQQASTASYTFTAGAPEEISLAGSNSNISYQLVDAFGDIIYPLSSAGTTTFGVGAGTYTLRVNGSFFFGQSTSLPFTFTASTLTTSTTVAPGGTATVTWTNGVPNQQIQIAAQAGISYLLTPAAAIPAGVGIFYSVIDATTGAVLQSGVASNGYYSNTPAISFTATASDPVIVQMSALQAGASWSSASTTFNLVQGQSATTPYTIGSTVTGTLNQVVDSSTYQFTLTQPTAVWLDISGGDYNVTLRQSGQSGTTSIVRPGVYQLAAGTYSLQLVPTQASPGTFTITSSTVAALPALTLGTTANPVTLAQGNQASAFQFTGMAGQQVHVDARWVSGNSPYQTWALIGPNGQVVTSGETQYTLDESQNVTLPTNGTYVIYLVGSSTDQAPDTSTLTVSPVTNSVTSINLGDQVSATLPGPGDTSQYTFTLTQATTVLVTPQGGSANVTLTQSNGQRVVSSSGSYINFSSGSNGLYYVVRLDPGTYSLNVTGTGSSTPGYAFSVSDVAASATAVGSGGTVAGVAPAQGAIGVYQLDTTPGATYNLGFTQPALTDSGDALTYSLVDVAGRTLASLTGTYFGQSVAFTAPQFGPVYLLVRQTTASTTPTSFSATLQQPVVSSTPLTWGSATSATFQTAQDQISYSFTQTQAGWIELQGITAPSSDVEYDIVAPNGNVVARTSGFGASAPGGTWDVDLAPGQYFIRVDANSDSADGGVTQFTAVQVPASQQIARQGGVPQALQLPNSGTALSLWTLDAQAGDALNLTPQTWSGTGTVQIVAPNGNTVAVWNPSAGPLNTTLGLAGTYLLRVTSNPLAGATANAFNLTATVGATATTQPVVSTFSAAGAISAGGTQTFQFQLTQAGLWMLDRNSAPDSYGYYYQAATITDQNGVTVESAYDQPALLAAGTYTITLHQNYINDSYNFTMLQLDSGQLPQLQYGQSVNATLPAFATVGYTINATAGDLVNVDPAGGTGNYAARNWQLVNQYGQVLQNGVTNGSSTSQPVQVATSGTLYLLFSGASPSDASGTLSFQVTQGAPTVNPITVGQVVSGTLSTQGNSRTYTFTVAQTTEVLFNAAIGGPSDGSQIVYQLIGPGSIYAIRYQYSTQSSSGSPGILTLEPGQYTVTVSDSSSDNAPFSFILQDASTVTPLTNAQPVQEQLPPTGQAQSYSVTAQAGDNLFFSIPNVPARVQEYDPGTGTYFYNYTASYEIADPTGNIVSSGSLQQLNATQFVALASGKYTLTLVDTNSSDQPLPYTLTAYINPPGTPITISLSNAVSPVDLTVTGVTVAPAVAGGTIESGGAIQVNWTTQNNGFQATSGNFDEHLVVRNVVTGAIVLQTDVPYVEAASGNGPIQPGESVSRSAILQLPNGIGSGDLEVLVETDADNSQNETGAALQNNISSATFTSALAPSPDLQVTGLSLSPATNWQAGDTVTVNWNAVNAGTAPALGSWTERMQLINNVTGAVVADVSQNFTNQDIAAGGQVARSATLTWPAGLNGIGTFSLIVTVDSTHQLAEYNAQGPITGDNSASKQLVVGPSIVAQQVGLLQSNPQDGEPVTVVWTDVNQGSVAVPAGYQDRVTLRQVNADGSLGAVVLDTAVSFAATNGSALAAGASIQRSMQLTLPAGVAGTGKFLITIGADSQTSGATSVFEVDASGTPIQQPATASTSFVSTEHVYPDLDVASLVVPSSVNSGGTATISWTVTNTGAATANGPWVDRLVLIPVGATGSSQDITLGNYTQLNSLAVGASYTQTVNVQIPGRLTGSYKIALISDANQVVAEPDTRANSTFVSGAISVSQTYTDLVPTLTQVPAQLNVNGTGSIAWTVTNNGTMPSDVSNWVDQVYLSTTPALGSNAILLGSVTHVGTVAIGGSYSAALNNFTVPSGIATGSYYVIVKTDAFGNTFELGHQADNVVAATTPTTVLPQPLPDLVVGNITAPSTWTVGSSVQVSYTIANNGNAAANGYMAENLQLVNVADPTQIISLGQPGASRQLAAGGSFTNQATITVPNMPTGNWRLQVTADANGYIAESNTANDSSSTPITVVSPDLAVDTLVTTGTLQGSSTVTLNWMTRNLGTADAGAFTDAVYLSQDGVVDAQSVMLGQVSRTGLAAGASIAGQLTFQTPVADSGSYQLIVVSNAGNTVNENGSVANDTAVLPVQIAQDSYEVLTVSNVQAPTQIVRNPANINVSYTVTNNGDGVGSVTTWTDELVYSPSGVLGGNSNDNIVLATNTHTGGLAVGASYNASFSAQFPPGFSSAGTLFVVTNVGNPVWQNGQTAGNVVSQPLTVMPELYADLTTSSVTASAPAVSGGPVTIQWNVANDGLGVTNTSNWDDRVWLSSNPDGTGTTYQLGSVSHIGQLAVGDSYTGSLTTALPQGIQGTFYVNVQAASAGTPYEFTHTGDAIATGVAVPITLSPSPDLVVQSIVAPGTAQEGGTMNLSWTVQNQGAGAANGPWIDTIQLIPASGTGAAISLGTFTYNQDLAPGISYTRTQQVTLPGHIDGGYVVQVTTNSNKAVYEYGAAANNDVTQASTPTVVLATPRPILQASNLSVPTQVTAGTAMSVSYTVTNNGPAVAAGQWTDNVYLSLNGQFDANSVLVATVPNVSALATGQSYNAQSPSFTVPLRYSGTVYVIVQPNGNGAIDEWPNGVGSANSGVSITPMQVNGAPFADLVTSNVVAPSQATYGSTINVSYTVTNQGSAATRAADGSTNESWTDTVWLATSKGQPAPVAGDILLGSTTHTGVLNPGQGYNGNLQVTLPADIASGQYYITVWTNPTGVIAQTELATNVNPDAPTIPDSDNFKATPISVIGAVQPDLTVTNVTAAPQASAGGGYSFSYTVQNQGNTDSGSWTDDVYLTNNPDPTKATTSWLIGQYNESQSLGLNQSYTVSDTVQLSPSVTGQYLVVVTNRSSSNPASQPAITESNYTNDTMAVASQVTATPADLQVTSVSVPNTEHDSGEPTTVTYTVANTGAAVWSGTKSWVDNIYFSSEPTFNPGQVTLLASVVHDNTSGLGTGQSYTTTASITPPAGTSGPYYIYVLTNNDPTNPSRDFAVASQEMTGGANQQSLGDFQSKVYEGTATTNNVAQGTINITYKEAALTVGNVTVSDPNPSAGETVTVTWTVTNTGNRATRVSDWYDGVYLSNGTSISLGDYALVRTSSGGFVFGGQPISFTDAQGNPAYLQPGQSYTNSAVVTLPTSISGNYHIIVKASTDLTLSEYSGGNSPPSDIRTGLDDLYQYDPTGMGAVQAFQNEGTNVASIALPIAAVTPPLLQIANVAVTPGDSAAPGNSPTAVNVTAGQDFTVNYTVANNGGSTPAGQSSWDDLIYLSKDPNNLDLNQDTFLGYVQHTGGLTAGGNYSNTKTFTAPQNLNGTYYVWVVTNPSNARGITTPAVLETPATQVENMAASAGVLIQPPPPADLVVQSVTAPTSAQAGATVALSYTVTNTSSNAASGNWTDAIYLSQGTTWSTSAVLLGKVTENGPLAAGASYTGTLQTTLPPLAEGSWHVIVRPDIYDNVGQNNNPALATAAGNAINVTVPALTLGTPVSTTLSTGQYLVYKITVAAGQTLAVNLNSTATTGNNEVYIKYGAIPTSSDYDAAYTQALAPSQQATIPSTQAGTYYVLVKSDSSPTNTPVTIGAKVLPLSITSISPTSGGAATAANQYVTMDIYGAAFAAGAQVVLSRPGVFQLQPQSWQVLDATHIQATFDLSNVPYGQYDVEVINPDGTTVTAPDQYLVTQAIQADVTVGIGGPSQVTPGDSGTYTLSLENLSNVNTPYVQFNVGATNLGVPDADYPTTGDALMNALGIPYLTFSSNVVGQPPGQPTATGGNNQQYGASPTDSASLPNINWSGLPALQNVDGFNLTPGFALNLADSGTIDATFNVQTYPGLTAWVNRDFPALRTALYALHPDWAAEGLLADGPQDLDKIQQGLTAQYLGTDPDTQTNLTQAEVLALSYTFNVFATATPLTRAQFVTEQTAYADQMRTAILKDPNAPVALQVLAANQTQWEQGWLAALEAGGVLLPDNTAPPISSEPEVMSLNAMLSTGILLQSGNQSYTTTSSLLSFFTQVQQWYGQVPSNSAVPPLSSVETRQTQDGTIVTSPVASAPNPADFGNPYSTASTQFIDLSIFSGGLAQLEYLRRIGVLQTGPDGVGFVPTGPAALNLLQYIQQASIAAAGTPAPVTVQGPTVTPTSTGTSYVPAGQNLPYTISFQNPTEEPSGQIRIVTQLDPNLNLASVQLGGIQIGNLNIQIPAGRADFQGTFDYTSSYGFILSVSAAVDPTQHTITWLLQALDPNTGAVLNSSTLGLLAGNPADPSAPAPTGFVSYTVQASPAAQSGAAINTSATIAFDNDPPVSSAPITYTLDATPPKTALTATPSGVDVNGNPTYNVSWNATDDASGVKYVTVYVAEDGGNFMIWQDHVSGASGQAVFTGQAGHTYQFLAAATDNAGNSEAASITNAVLPSDGTAQQVAAGLGSTPTVSTTPPTPATPEGRTYVSNNLFTQAQQQLPGPVSTIDPPDLQSVLAPMALQSFASGFGTGAADIGAMAMVELPNQTVLVSAGTNRNEVFAYPKTGGQSTTPLFTLNAPVVSMAVDSKGQLWVTTGDQLLQVDPTSGTILQAINGPGGEPLTQALAIDPSTGLIYVSSGNGIEVYNPAAGGSWSHFSNSQVTGLAFGPDGRLWGVLGTGSTIANAQTNPTSSIVSFPMSGPGQGQAQLEYTLAGTVDNIAFGQAGTQLAGLLFASTSLPQQAIPQGGAAAPHQSVVWMVSLATRQSLQLAAGGTQGEALVATSDGRLLVAQTDSVDQIAPAAPPHVTASSVPSGALVTLPLGSISVTFDESMWLGANGADPTDPGSVLNPANFTLVSTATGSDITLNPTSITWNAATNTATLTLPALAAGGWQLQVSNNLLGADQINLAHSYASSFTAAINFSDQVKLSFTNTRVDHATGQVSYDVSITNIGNEDIHGPLSLLLDPGQYFNGQVSDGAQDGSSYWTLDLTAALDAQGGVLAAGATLANQTVTVGPSAALLAATGTGQLVKFNMGSGVYAVPYDDTPPTVTVVSPSNSSAGATSSASSAALLDSTPSGTVTNADGSKTVTTNDGQGNVTQKIYAPGGTLLSDKWTRSDGSYGTDTYNADGSDSGTVVNADGSSRTFHEDAQGNSAFTDYDASDQETDTGTISVNANGTTSTVLRYVDGTTRSTTVNATGNGNIYFYDDSGALSASSTVVVSATRR